MKKILLIVALAFGLNALGQNQPVPTSDLIGVVVSPFYPMAHMWLSKTEQSNLKLHYVGQKGLQKELIELTIDDEKVLLKLEELFYDLLESKDTNTFVIEWNLSSRFSVSQQDQGVVIQSVKDARNWFSSEPILSKEDIKKLFGHSPNVFSCSCDWAVVPENENLAMISEMTINKVSARGTIMDTASFKTIYEGYNWCSGLIESFRLNPSKENIKVSVEEGQKIIFDRPDFGNQIVYKMSRATEEDEIWWEEVLCDECSMRWSGQE